MPAIVARVRVVRVNDPMLFGNLKVRPEVVFPFDRLVEQVLSPETVCNQSDTLRSGLKATT